MEHSHSDKPSDFLVENVHLLPRGRVLDIAMGSGRNAVYLAGLGFEVEGVDISPDAVSDALEAAERAAVKIRARVADLEKGHCIEPGAYDVIICFNYLQRSLMPQIREGLRYGGMVVYETFIVDQSRYGKPRNPDHLLKHNELLDIFRDFRCLHYREGICPGPKAVAGIVAERTGRTSASS
ncbi:MAG: methyltransferase domain-containing protein [Dehalococcoidia bacterium]|nr:methyltransferase domain-containing protein [Dehalococcoidia bacterium]